MKNNLTITIVTANYNNSPFLSDFFRSVCNSSSLPDELIFVDDASTDNSIAIANEWAKKCGFPVKVINLTKNQGFANALNLGIKASSHSLILRVDPDDFIHPKRIEKEKSFLECNPKIHIVGSNTFYFNQQKQKNVGKSFFPANHHKIKKLHEDGFVGISNGSFSARKEIFDVIEYEQKYVPYEEYVVFSKMIKSNFTVENLPDHLTYYRIHNQKRCYQSALRKQKGISEQREIIFGKKTSLLTTHLRTLANFFYWKSLTAPNQLVKWAFFAAALPFKIRSVIERIRK